MGSPLFEVRCRTEKETERLGRRLAALLRPGDMVGLEGPLGAGKSVLARAAVRSVMGDPALDVPSPSFTLVQPYETAGRPPVLHVDLYRIDDPADLVELGLEDLASDAITFVEWSDRAEGMLPPGRLVLRIESQDGEGRRIGFHGDPGWRERLAALDPAHTAP